MKRKEFYLIIEPLTERLYRFAYSLIPEDLQAEQLIIDGFNAFLIKQKKNLLRREVDFKEKRDLQVLRKIYFKAILRHISEIGLRRSTQLQDHTRLNKPSEFKAFYNLEPKLRMILSLRFDAQLTVEEIEEISQMAKYEVIEKLHNGRFLLMNELNKGVIAHG